MSYKQILHIVTMCASVFCLCVPSARSEMQLGGGVHYWRTLDEIDVDDIDDDGLAWYLSFQIASESLVTLEIDIEQLPEEMGGGDDEIYAPIGYVLLGTGVYGGVGIGGYYSDGEFHEDPVYALRAGLRVVVVDPVFLDINANYRFHEWDDVDEIDDDIGSETITLGVAARVQF